MAWRRSTTLLCSTVDRRRKLDHLNQVTSITWRADRRRRPTWIHSRANRALVDLKAVRKWGLAEGLQSNRWRAPGPGMPIMARQQFEVNGPVELDLPITRRVP
jgi:hypothetical protein